MRLYPRGHCPLRSSCPALNHQKVQVYRLQQGKNITDPYLPRTVFLPLFQHLHPQHHTSSSYSFFSISSYFSSSFSSFSSSSFSSICSTTDMRFTFTLNPLFITILPSLPLCPLLSPASSHRIRNNPI